jgi:DNA (cytosine-5)-methyltransferase 1
VTYDFGVRRLTPLECERLQGFPDTWSIPNLVDGESAGSYDTERYRAIGNAVAIPVVEWVARRVHICLDNLRSEADLTQQPIATDDVLLSKLAAEFDTPSTKKLELAHAQCAKWQRGGCAFRGSVVHAPVSTRPITTVESTMGDIIEKVRVDERYFLSPNAARGIINRVERRGRHLFAPLDASLRRLVKRNSDSHEGPRAVRTISPSGAVA